MDRRHDTYESLNGEEQPLLSNVAIASPAKSTWKPPPGFIWIEIGISHTDHHMSPTKG
jgi:hypothetical protein